jgi:transposase-like protein
MDQSSASGHYLCAPGLTAQPLWNCQTEYSYHTGLSVGHSTIARWVLHHAPILERRIRREMRHPNRSSRVDETYVRVAGKWTYLYRAIDSAGDTIDFLLSPNRDLIAAKGFLRLAVVNVVVAGRSTPQK